MAYRVSAIDFIRGEGTVFGKGLSGVEAREIMVPGGRSYYANQNVFSDLKPRKVRIRYDEREI